MARCHPFGYIINYRPEYDYLYVGRIDRLHNVIISAHPKGLLMWEKLGTNGYPRRHIIPGEYSITAVAEFIVEKTGVYTYADDERDGTITRHRRLCKALRTSGLWERRGRLNWKDAPGDLFRHLPLRAFVEGSTKSYAAWWPRYLANQYWDLCTSTTVHPEADAPTDDKRRARAAIAAERYRSAKALITSGEVVAAPHLLAGFSKKHHAFRAHNRRDHAILNNDPAWTQVVRLIGAAPTHHDADPADLLRLFGDLTFGMTTNRKLVNWLDREIVLSNRLSHPYTLRGLGIDSKAKANAYLAAKRAWTSFPHTTPGPPREIDVPADLPAVISLFHPTDSDVSSLTILGRSRVFSIEDIPFHLVFDDVELWQARHDGYASAKPSPRVTLRARSIATAFNLHTGGAPLPMLETPNDLRERCRRHFTDEPWFAENDARFNQFPDRVPGATATSCIDAADADLIPF